MFLIEYFGEKKDKCVECARLKIPCKEIDCETTVFRFTSRTLSKIQCLEEELMERCEFCASLYGYPGILRCVDKRCPLQELNREMFKEGDKLASIKLKLLEKMR